MGPITNLCKHGVSNSRMIKQCVVCTTWLFIAFSSEKLGQLTTHTHFLHLLGIY